MDNSMKSMGIHPYDKANLLSKLVFWWMVDIFKKGYSKVLDISDLSGPRQYDKSELIGSELEQLWNDELKRCADQAKAKNITDPDKMPKPSLLRPLFRLFKWRFIVLGLAIAINDGLLRMYIPVSLGRLLEYFTPNSTVSTEDALLNASLIVFLNFVSAIIMNHFMLNAFHCGMRARVAVCSLIYRKSLRLSRTALGDSAPGKVVNLLSNDVNRFDMAAFFVHFLWVAPLCAFIVLWLLLNQIGLSGLLGVLVVFTVMPIQTYTGKLSAKFRLQTAIRTDERVRLMDEIISGVQVIKMYAWEKPFAKLIAMARKMEIKIVRKNSYVRAAYMSFLLFTTRCAIFCTMAFIVLSGDTLTASKVFVFAQYFGTLSMTMSGLFVRAIAETAEAWVSVKRLEKYLGQDEFVEKKMLMPAQGKDLDGDKKELAEIVNGKANNNAPPPLDRNVVLRMSKASGRWLHDSEEMTLKNIDVQVLRGKMVAIIGPVGSGKTSLLQAILGEMNLDAGYVNINGTVSYASQEPWIFGSTVRQNILFGLHYDKFRYNEVVRVCALQKDFQQFSNGDQTLVGERGTALSGGQKARINLARAVYRQSDIYLLDDPLSAVDAHVGRHLYEQCMQRHLRKATRLLVTHQLHYLSDADYIIMMRDGAIEMQGSYHDLATSSLEYARLLIAPSQEKSEEENVEFEVKESAVPTKERIRNRRASRQNSFSSLHSFRSMSKSSSYVDLVDVGDDDEAEEHAPQTVLIEQSSKGTVKGSIGVHYANAASNPFGIFFIILMFALTQTLASAFDYFVSVWTAQEELRSFYRNLNQTQSQPNASTTIEPSATNATAFNDTLSIPDNIRPYDSLLSTNFCLMVQGVLVLLILVVGLLRAMMFYNSCMTASKKLHGDMFKGIIQSPMKFFDENPSGRIMNRFSKDMGSIDELLPKAAMDATQMIMTIVGAIVMTAVVNPIYLAVLGGLSIFFYFLRKVFLKTSKNVKRLEGMSRSPVFTHLGATLQGLPTIRCSNSQEICKLEFDNYQDTHTTAYFTFIAAGAAFGFCLDLLCLVFVGAVTFSFFVVGKDMLGDQVGLAITQAMSLTFLMQYGVRQSAEVANHLMAVERVLEYKYLQPEPAAARDEEDKRRAAKMGIKLPTFKTPPRDWPEHGRIEFQKLRMRYGLTEKDPYVLDQLNCVFESKQKVGIVGRTGAGKSSLIQALFRLAYVEGDIIIDGVNTADITIEDLRKQLSIIPQDPMLFSGTLRRNLDPFEEYSDKLLWQVLEAVELKESLANPAGLEMRVMDGGSNFSVGQRQLVCLARALLRNNKILMMDEATANVDPHTDALIQQTIRTKFADCTVLTIAHRLNTIMDSDKVLVMDQGKMVEFGHPHELLEMRGSNPSEDGYFRKMVLETGPDSAPKLEEIARTCFEKSQNKMQATH